MARAFSSWTVLPHQPIEKLQDNLWRVEGFMPDGKTQRSMAVARMNDGRLVIHNAIALDDAEMKELEDWGKPSILVVPNGFHRQDARIYKQRYPELRVVCPAGARKAVGKVVPVDTALEEVEGDESVSLMGLDGAKAEGVLSVRSGEQASLVFCDAVLNMRPRKGLTGFFLGPTGRLSVPRLMRMIGFKNKAAARAHLERLADTPGLARILVGHGSTCSQDAAQALKSAAQALGA